MRDANGQLFHGDYKEFFKDGSVSNEGEYEHGSKSGEWKYYFAGGLLKSVGNFVEWRNGRLLDPGTAKTAN